MLANNQKGYALVYAIVVMVVLSVLASAGVSLVIEQNDDALREYNSDKVYYGTLAAQDWALYTLIDSPSSCFTSPKTDLTLDALNINNLSVNITCSQDNATEQVYTVTSKVSSGVYGDKDYAFRKITRVVHIPV